MLVKKWACTFSPLSPWLTHGELLASQSNYSVSFFVLAGIFKKDGSSFFCENNGGVERPYLLVAPIFKGSLN